MTVDSEKSPESLPGRVQQALAQITHSKGCNFGASLAASHPHLAAYIVGCTCDREHRVAAAVAEAISRAARQGLSYGRPEVLDSEVETVSRMSLDAFREAGALAALSDPQEGK